MVILYQPPQIDITTDQLAKQTLWSYTHAVFRFCKSASFKSQIHDNQAKSLTTPRWNKTRDNKFAKFIQNT